MRTKVLATNLFVVRTSVRIDHYEPVCSADFSPHWLKNIEKLSVLLIDNIL